MRSRLLRSSITGGGATTDRSPPSTCWVARKVDRRAELPSTDFFIPVAPNDIPDIEAAALRLCLKDAPNAPRLGPFVEVPKEEFSFGIFKPKCS